MSLDVPSLSFARSEGRRDDGDSRSSHPVDCTLNHFELDPFFASVMPHPVRSQSFRHRSRPSYPTTVGNASSECGKEGGKKHPLEGGEAGQERRRSTPTVSRRCSLQRYPPRTDVWPEPKPPSEVAERFLRLPDAEDYTRVRQFKIDARGAVVSRGDSFRRKRQAQPSNNGGSDVSASGSANRGRHDSQTHTPSPFPLGGDTDSVGGEFVGNGAPVETVPAAAEGSASRSTSISSAGSALAPKSPTKSDKAPHVEVFEADDDASAVPHPAYRILVVGAEGSGKSSLIGQFITSDYRNTFACADEVEEQRENTVSISIGGHECDLCFVEADPQLNPDWSKREVEAYLLVYSIDRKNSFRTVLKVLEEIRDRKRTSGVPVILAGNKVDLERKRAVAAQEVRAAAYTYNVAHFEISVALNHDIDDLLVGIVAEIKEFFAERKRGSEGDESAALTIRSTGDGAANRYVVPGGKGEQRGNEDFQAAIRRFSQRKKRQMGGGMLELESSKCVNLNPAGLFEKFRQWRRSSRC